MSKVTVGDTADKLYNYKLNIGKMFDTRVYKLLIFLQSHSLCLSLKYMHTEKQALDERINAESVFLFKESCRIVFFLLRHLLQMVTTIQT